MSPQEGPQLGPLVVPGYHTFPSCEQFHSLQKGLIPYSTPPPILPRKLTIFSLFFNSNFDFSVLNLVDKRNQFFMLVVPAVLFPAMAEQYFEAELIFILSHEYSEKSMTLSDVTDLGID